MDHWLELRTAYYVAKHGTVTEAAKALGVHRATVNRHVDALEEMLKTKLFIRHNKGYELTETGQEFLTISSRADEMFTDFVGHIKSTDTELSGEIILTAPAAVCGLFMRPIIQFRTDNPMTRVTILADDALTKLEYGEAHIALRGGPKPQHPDYIVQHFAGLRFGLYASSNYIARKGLPKTVEEFPQHEFVLNKGFSNHLAFGDWIETHISEDLVVVTTSKPDVIIDAVMTGVAIGFLPKFNLDMYSGLHEVMHERDDWFAPLWLVTHADLHRTEKVQAMLRCIKDTYSS